MSETALTRFELALQSNEVAQTFQTSSFKMNVSREIQFALQHLQKNEYLQGASPESVKNAIVNVALTGLSLHISSNIFFSPVTFIGFDLRDFFTLSLSTVSNVDLVDILALLVHSRQRP